MKSNTERLYSLTKPMLLSKSISLIVLFLFLLQIRNSGVISTTRFIFSEVFTLSRCVCTLKFSKRTNTSPSPQKKLWHFYQLRKKYPEQRSKYFETTRPSRWVGLQTVGQYWWNALIIYHQTDWSTRLNIRIQLVRLL